MKAFVVAFSNYCTLYSVCINVKIEELYRRDTPAISHSSDRFIKMPKQDSHSQNLIPFSRPRREKH